MLKKIGLGAGFWAIMFIGISAIMVIPMPTILQKILGIVLSGVAAYILGVIYFKKSPGEIKDGFILGVIWFIVSLVLDLLITVQYVKGGIPGGSYIDGLKTFYGTWNLWVGILAMFVTLVIVAKTTRGGELMKPPVPKPPRSPQQPSAGPPPGRPQV